jgi:hypothetical protein
MIIQFNIRIFAQKYDFLFDKITNNHLKFSIKMTSSSFSSWAVWEKTNDSGSKNRNHRWYWDCDSTRGTGFLPVGEGKTRLASDTQ